MSKKNDLKYTLDRLYECRNLEITNLWQRSVFLTAFLLLCFTAYGYLANQMIAKLSSNEECSLLNISCIVVSSVGAIFSTLWVYMAKGSKAWYEIYENAITKFENDHKDKLKIQNDYIMGNMKSNFDDKIFSTTAGNFSPSKINILIGQISIILWLIFIIIHLLINFCSSTNIDKYDLFILIILFISWIIFDKGKERIKSKHIK